MFDLPVGGGGRGGGKGGCDFTVAALFDKQIFQNAAAFSESNARQTKAAAPEGQSQWQFVI